MRPDTSLAPRIFYRLSDFTQITTRKDGSVVVKTRPDFFDKRTCLLNALSVFENSEISVLADNVGEETWAWLNRHCAHLSLSRSNHGNGAASFREVLEQAVNLPDNRLVYFLEDDYLHMPGSEKVLIEGFKYADYVTLFDHPDKYINGGEGRNGVPGNPLISDESEETRVYRTASTHWKITNSATMTFATSRDFLRADKKVIDFYVKTSFPRDYHLFRDLLDKVGRKLCLPLPSWSTHCETAFLAPYRDWASLSK